MPVGARYSPKMSRKVCDHSPVVTPACAHKMDAGMMLEPPRAVSARLASAALTSAALRWARKALSRSICSRSARGSTFMMPLSLPPVSGDSSVSLKQLRPTILRAPLSMARIRSVWLVTSCRLT